jgi:hypothetical protein
MANMAIVVGSFLAIITVRIPSSSGEQQPSNLDV